MTAKTCLSMKVGEKSVHQAKEHPVYTMMQAPLSASNRADTLLVDTSTFFFANHQSNRK